MSDADADAVVVGAGVGGLAAAIRLAAGGRSVVVVERLERVGGKLASAGADGFRWETGPSLLTLRHVFDELAAAAGHRLEDHLELVRLDPVCGYRFPDGSGFTVRGAVEDTIAAVDALSPGSGPQYRAFIEHGLRIWEVAERTFFAGPMGSPLSLVRRMRSPRDLLAIDGLRTLDSRTRATFDDPRLVQWANRYATYSGSSPYEAPATLSCIAAVEQVFGAWYVMGGLDRLAAALAAVAVSVGVEIRLDTEVRTITHDGRAATGVVLAGGERIGAGAVVVNADAHDLHRRLLDPTVDEPRSLASTARSSSGYVLLLGVDGTLQDSHHRVLFGPDQRGEFDQLFSGRPQTDPTIYVCASSVTDPSVAPPGTQNWFVLVNAPAGAGAMPGYGDHVLGVLARRGVDLAGRIRHRRDITPADIEHTYRTPGGSIYGTSSNGRRAAFARPNNRGPLDRLFLCGGSSHPGGGLPLVAVSGAIAADLAEASLAGR